MATPERPPGGSHRRAGSNSRLAVLIASLLGIAIIAVVVTVTLNKRGEPAHKNAPQPTRSTLHKSSPTPTRPGPSAASLSPGPTPTSPTAVASTAGASGAASSATATGAASTAAGAVRPELDVLNDSRVTGLAARAASTFRAGGWDVASTGNFHGADVPETTIFYPDGDKAAADQLAAQFGIHRLELASTGMSRTQLTVALARDWAQRG